jgi:hypothetical protein
MSRRLHTDAKIPPASFTPPHSNVLQRKGEAERLTVPPIVHDVLRSPGRPLDKESRDYFDRRLGHDFSQVRIHSDEQAAESAHRVNAVAYTVGRNIVFGTGQHRPETTSGRRLLAHELAHVVQQGAVEVMPTEVGPANDPLEHEADAIAERMDQSRGVAPSEHIGSIGAQRQPALPVGRLQRTPPDPTSQARYPTATERTEVMNILNPQQQAAAASGSASVDPVDDAAQFQTDMESCMNDYIDRVLPEAQARESSTVSLGLPEVQSLSDLAQREVNRFFSRYLTAAVHSQAEQQRLANFQLRSHVHMVSQRHSDADLIACNWLTSRMADACGANLGSHNVLASISSAKRSCSPSSSSSASSSGVAATTPANERDQALFQSVRDAIFSARQNDLRTIVMYSSSFETGGEAFIQDKIRARSGESAPDTMIRGRWEALGTIIHEMLHAVAHEQFSDAIRNVENTNVGVEGFAEYFARLVHNDIRARAANDDALRTSVEGVATPTFDSSRATERTGGTYQPYVDQVTAIRDHLAGNEESLRVAYFMGRLEYIGLGGWNATEAERRDRLRYPANTLGFAALLTTDTRGLLTVDYARIVVGRGGPFQFGLGGQIYYLTPGERREEGGAVFPESGRLGVGGRAMVQYQWPNFYIRAGLGVGASTGFDRPFEQSVRLDIIPGIEAGVRIGWAHIGAGTQILFPVVGGPVAERTVRAGALLGVSAEY